jgi:hypothetical protein
VHANISQNLKGKKKPNMYKATITYKSQSWEENKIVANQLHAPLANRAILATLHLHKKQQPI